MSAVTWTTFAGWFDQHYRCEDESVSRAITRFAYETGLAYGTLYWAYRGARVAPETARRLSRLTDGAVPVEVLVFGPTREEVRRTKRDED